MENVGSRVYNMESVESVSRFGSYSCDFRLTNHLNGVQEVADLDIDKTLDLGQQAGSVSALKRLVDSFAEMQGG